MNPPVESGGNAYSLFITVSVSSCATLWVLNMPRITSCVLPLLSSVHHTRAVQHAVPVHQSRGSVAKFMIIEPNVRLWLSWTIQTK